MKENIKGGELERIEAELFGSLDLDDESSIGAGGTITHTGTATYTPNGFDAIVDLDYQFDE